MTFMYLVADHLEPYMQYTDNLSFKQWLSDTIFGTTYQPPASAIAQSPVARRGLAA